MASSSSTPPPQLIVVVAGKTEGTAQQPARQRGGAVHRQAGACCPLNGGRPRRWPLPAEDTARRRRRAAKGESSGREPFGRRRDRFSPLAHRQRGDAARMAGSPPAAAPTTGARGPPPPRGCRSVCASRRKLRKYRSREGGSVARPCRRRRRKRKSPLLITFVYVIQHSLQFGDVHVFPMTELCKAPLPHYSRRCKPHKSLRPCRRPWVLQ